MVTAYNNRSNIFITGLWRPRGSFWTKIVRSKLIHSKYDIEVQRKDPNSPLYSVKSFEALHLKPELLKSVYSMGFDPPSKIQETAVSTLLADSPQNRIAQCQSGTDETAAFVLAILSRIEPELQQTQALCLSPTCELDVQTGEIVAKMAQYCHDITIKLALRGEEKPTGKEHIIIRTPGKVVDWSVKHKLINLSKLTVFVLDGADVMMTRQGHPEQSLRIRKFLSKNCQMIFFSATYNSEVMEFAELMVPNAVIIRLKREEESLNNIEQYYVKCEDDDKKYTALTNARETATEETIELENCICEEFSEYYSSLIDKLNEFTKRVDAFTNNAPSKTFLRKLKMAVKKPVNTICTIDTAHMRDKFIEISQLLRVNFSLPDVPMPNLPKDLYFAFVVDYLCKHFIEYAEDHYTLKKPKEAQLSASLALAIWSEFPEFGSILLAKIMKKCPYVIPGYISLDNEFKSDELKDEQKFVSRMTGIFIFYISLMVTPCRRNQSHPFGIENAWKWIAASLNLEPHPNVASLTANFLSAFLEICGYQMNHYYGIQFRKILQILIDDYVPKMEKITPSDFRAPVGRLKLFFEEKDVLRKGFNEPKELLSADHWF